MIHIALDGPDTMTFLHSLCPKNLIYWRHASTKPGFKLFLWMCQFGGKRGEQRRRGEEEEKRKEKRRKEERGEKRFPFPSPIGTCIWKGILMIYHPETENVERLKELMTFIAISHASSSHDQWDTGITWERKGLISVCILSLSDCP